MTYSEILQQLLDEKDMRPSELARLTDTSRKTIDSLLHGKAKEPKLRMAKKISDALGVPIDYFTDRMDMS